MTNPHIEYRANGFHHTPLIDISNLRQNLKGYGSKEAFVKEVLQNADDAGAKLLRIAWLAGVQNSDHPLLRGPALLMVNDAPFGEKHADAIIRMGLGSKAGEEHAIGKFGLGIKSVFQVCEAFLFFAGHPEGGDDFRIVRVLNPWHGAHHSEWDTLSSADVGRIATASASLRPADRPWFLMWLPLRRESHLQDSKGSSVAAIRKEFPGDLTEPSPGVEKIVNQLVPLLFPLLKSVERVEFRSDLFDEKNAKSLTVCLGEDANRCRFDVTSREEGKLEGAISINEVNSCHYVGLTRWISEPELDELKQSDYWPRVVVIRENGADAAELEKAHPHCGAVMHYSSRSDSGRLKILWSVFLPVGEEPYEEVGIDLCLDLTLNLHGYFFLNATRTQIDGLDREGAYFPKSERDRESGVCREWNRLLASRGTLPLLPELLERFVATQGGEERATVARKLTEAIDRSNLVRRFRPEITRTHAWAFRLTAQGGQWAACPVCEKVLSLAPPPQGHLDTLRRALPGIAGWLEKEQNVHLIIVGTHEGFPGLTGQSVAEWSLPDVEMALGKCTEDQFSGFDKALKYLLFEFLGPLSIELRNDVFQHPLAGVRLFRTSSDGGNELVSPQTIVHLKKSDLLYDYGSDSRLFNRLLRALPGKSIRRLSQDYSFLWKLLSALPTLDAETSATLVLESDNLGDVAARKALLDELLGRLDWLYQESPERMAIRYLVHACFENRNSSKTLFRQNPSATTEWDRIVSHVLRDCGESWRLVDREFDLNQTDCDRIGIETIGSDGVQSLLEEVGRGIGFADLPIRDREFLIKNLDDNNLLRQMRLHELANGELSAVNEHTYLDADFQFEEQLRPLWNILAASAQVVTRSRDRMVRVRQEEVFGTQILNENGIIRLACEHHEPGKFWPLVMAALGRVGTPAGEVLALLRSTAWLPLETGTGFVRPEKVISLPGADEAVQRALPSGESHPVTPLDLETEIRTHSGYRALREKIFPGRKGSLVQLADALSDQPEFRTGLPAICQADVLESIVVALEGFSSPQFPLLAILFSIASRKESDLNQWCCETLGTRLSGPLSSDAYIEILVHIQERHATEGTGKRDELSHVHRIFFEAALDYAQWDSIRHSIKLPNGLEVWKSSSELVLPFRGISKRHHVSERYAKLLRAILPYRADDDEIEDSVADSGIAGEDSHEIESSTEVLQEYFDGFDGNVPESCIGMFAMALGGQEMNLAWLKQLLEVPDVESVRDKVIPPDLEAAGRNVVEVWRRTQFVPTIHEDETIKAESLTGQVIPLPVDPEGDSLLYGDSAFKATGWIGGQGYDSPIHRLQLLAPKFLVDRSEEEILNRLRKTGELILENVFCVDDRRGFRELFDRLRSSDGSLQLRIAQRMIVKSGDNLIQILGTHQHDQVRETLGKWHRAKQLEAQVEEGLGENRAANEARCLVLEAEKEFREFLEEEGKIQKVFLDAVRRKMREFQYSADSIPFEIFQNADDAYVELDALQEVDPSSKPCFVVQVEGTSIRFLHWGRPIDYPRTGTREGIEGAGYDRDLQKMLILSSSDKAITGENEPNRTGKFGLGFKSVHLASDRPAVLSAKLAFEIRAGLFPVRLSPSDDRKVKLDEVLEAYEPRYSTPGTLFDIPLHHHPGALDPDLVLGRFIALGPYLALFAKKISSVELKGIGGNAHSVSVFKWEPRSLSIPGASVGSLGQYENNEVHGLVFEADQDGKAAGCSLFFEIGAKGFADIPDEVPRLWVTAPTWENSNHGVLVNGPFEVDTGRRQLAFGSKGNETLAEAFGREVGAFLCELASVVDKDWETVRKMLGLAEGSQHSKFWRTLWGVVVEPRARRLGEGENKADQLLDRILIGDRTSGLGRLLCSHRVCPSGLGNDDGPLVCLEEVTSMISGVLDRHPILFASVRQWPGFAEEYPLTNTISESRTGKAIERLMPWCEQASVSKVRLCEVLLSTVGDDKRVDPTLARLLGGTLSKEAQTEVLARDPLAKSEFNQLEEILRTLLFQTEESTYVCASDLVTGKLEKDEQLRSQIAPLAFRLNPEYQGNAVDFFSLCRGDVSAGADRLADWSKGAAGPRLKAVFAYLLEGEAGISNNLADKLGADWFASARQNDEFDQLADVDQRRLHLLFDYEVSVEGYESKRDDEDFEYEYEEGELLEIFEHSPEELLDWWRRKGEPAAPYTFTGEMRCHLFPHLDQGEDEPIRVALSEPDSPEGREAWFRTLCYCCLIGARVHPTSVKNFWKEQLEQRDFFQRTIPDPGIRISDDDEFIRNTQDLFDDIIHRYLRGENAAGEDAELWRRIFYDSRKMFLAVYVNELPSLFLDVVPQLDGAEMAIRLLKSGEFPGHQRLQAVIGQSFSSPLFLLMRELRRLRVINQPLFDPTCFYVRPSIRRAAAKIGAIELGSDYSFGQLLDYSRGIYQWVENSSVAEEFFDGVFDIPLFHLAETRAYDEL